MEIPTLIDERILWARSQPTRAEILNILSEGPSSPSRMQRRMDGVSLEMVAHHVKVLREAGLIKLKEVRKHGGRKEHVYEVTSRQSFDVEEWEAVDPKFREPVIAGILRQISNDTGRAAIEGKFSEFPESHLSRSPIELDDAGWAHVTEILAEALDGILKAHDESKERAQEGDLMPVRVVIMQFPVGTEDLED